MNSPAQYAHFVDGSGCVAKKMTKKIGPTINTQVVGRIQTMTRSKLIVPAVAATASATVVGGHTAAAHASPVGPCAEVPFVGVCVPASEQPTPPQQSHPDTFIPDSTGGIPFVN
jgi:hypothetical protein